MWFQNLISPWYSIVCLVASNLMAYPMLSIVGCSLMTWWNFLVNTERIVLCPLSGFILTSPNHNSIDLVVNGSTFGFLCLLLLIGSWKVDVRSKSMLVAEVILWWGFKSWIISRQMAFMLFMVLTICPILAGVFWSTYWHHVHRVANVCVPTLTLLW